MSEAVQQVVEQFNEIVKPDGGQVRLCEFDGGVLRVSYRPGVNEECAECVMEPEALGAMMHDMLKGLSDDVLRVEVETEEES